MLSHVEDALAVGALGELVGLEGAATDRFGDADAAACAHGALDVCHGHSATAAADIVVEVEGARWQAGAVRLAAGFGARETGCQPGFFFAERGRAGLPIGFGPEERLFGGGVCRLECFDARHQLEELVFQGGALGLEEFDFVLDVAELFGVADRTVVEALLLRDDAGVEDADLAIELALGAAGVGEPGLGGGEGRAGGIEFFTALEAALDIFEGSAKGSCLIIEILECSEAGDLGHGRYNPGRWKWQPGG